MQDITVYKETHDNWCPSFAIYNEAISLVELSFYELYKDLESDPAAFGVSVNGMDDLSVEMQFLSEPDAWQAFITLLSLPILNITDVQQLKEQLIAEDKLCA